MDEQYKSLRVASELMLEVTEHNRHTPGVGVNLRDEQHLRSFIVKKEWGIGDASHINKLLYKYRAQLKARGITIREDEYRTSIPGDAKILACLTGDIFIRSDWLEELQRELAVRQKVYPEWIRKGQIKAGTAKKRIEALAGLIEALSVMQPKQNELFT